MHVDLSDPHDKEVILQAVRDKYAEVKPIPLTAGDLKDAARNAQIIILRDIINGENSVAENTEQMDTFLRSIGVESADVLQEEYNLLKKLKPITSQGSKEALEELEDRVLKRALDGDDSTTALDILTRKGLLDPRLEKNSPATEDETELLATLKSLPDDKPSDDAIANQLLADLQETFEG